MPTSIDLDPTRTHQDVYARLVDLCERGTELSDESHLCVMEAFNELTEIEMRLPDGLPDIYYGPVADVLQQVRRLLGGLIASSSVSETALAFLRVDACIESAIEHQI